MDKLNYIFIIILVILFALSLILLQESESEIDKIKDKCGQVIELDNEILETTGAYLYDMKLEPLAEYMENMKPIRQEKIDYCLQK